MFVLCINSIKTLLLFQLMHTIIKNHRMLKQFKNYNTLLRHVSVHAGTIIREQPCV